MRAKHLLVPALMLPLLTLSSCALLPEEEVLRTAPLVEPYVGEQFDTVTVERGDLILTENVSCRYVPVQTAKLSFSLGGEYIDQIMVEAGDSVKKGQLLGQLQLEDLENRIEDTENVIAELNLQMNHVRELQQLELRRFEITSRSMEEMEKQEAFSKLQEDYNVRLGELNDALSLQQLALDTLRADLDERRIFAPFDGTVTFVSNVSDGEMSVFGSHMITLVDSTMSLFRAETEFWNYFSSGDECEIVVDKKTYPAVVTDEESLGLEPTEHAEGKSAFVYFMLKEPSFELEDGDRGRITLMLDQRLDVLHIPAKAVSSANGQPIVYYRREDGMKAYKPVETGLTVGERIEIVSGLIEGESIIAD